jgi:hypothetical protein
VGPLLQPSICTPIQPSRGWDSNPEEVVLHHNLKEYGEALSIQIGDHRLFGTPGKDYIQLCSDGPYLHLDDLDRYIAGLRNLAGHLALLRDPDGDRDPADESEFDQYLYGLSRTWKAQDEAKRAAQPVAA